MKLDHPSMFAFEHSAGGFGIPDTPTFDEGTYVGPISLHNAIGPKRPHPAPLRAFRSVSSLSALSRSLSSCSRSGSGPLGRSARASEWGPAASRRPPHITPLAASPCPGA